MNKLCFPPSARRNDLWHLASEAFFLKVYHQKSPSGLCGSHLVHIGLSHLICRSKESSGCALARRLPYTFAKLMVNRLQNGYCWASALLTGLCCPLPASPGSSSPTQLRYTAGIPMPKQPPADCWQCLLHTAAAMRSAHLIKCSHYYVLLA